MRKLCWACGGFCGAVLLAMAMQGERAVLLAALLMLPPLALSFFLRGKNRLRVLLASAFAVLGFLCCLAQRYWVIAPAEALDGVERTVTMELLDYPQTEEGYASLTVRLAEDDLPRVKCRLTVYGAVSSLKPGQLLRGSVNFRSALYRYGELSDSDSSRGIFLRAYSTEAPTVCGSWGHNWFFAPLRLRRAVLKLCRELFPADTLPFQQALLLGEKGELYENTRLYYALSRAGIMHVAAVSGMHVAFLVGVGALLIPDKRRLFWIAAPLLLLFAAMVGFTPSVSRAVFLQLSLLLASVLRREADPPTALLLVLALLLAQNPCAAASISLQLSFAAMGGILLFSNRIYGWLNGRLSIKSDFARKLYSAAAAAASSSLAALVFTLPLTAWHFGYVSLISPVSNVLCLWLISLLFVGGYAALLVGSILPWAGRAIGALLGWGCRGVFGVCTLLSRLPLAAVYTSQPLYRLFLAFAYIFFAVAWLCRDREKDFNPLPPLLGTLLCLLCCALGVRAQWNGEARVTAIDMGQGSCTLLECGESAWMVDCGSTNRGGYPGQEAAYLALGRGRKRLDGLILTHLHRDHVNEVESLLALVEVDTLYLPAGEAELLDEVLAAAVEQNTRVVYVEKELLLSGGDMTLRITEPLGREEEYERGLMVLASHGDFDVLITGDASASLERRLLLERGLPDLEVLVVGHHGSAGSTSEFLLRHTHPELALISVGYNTYGHPTEQTLERLEKYGAEIHRTDTEGSVTVREG